MKMLKDQKRNRPKRKIVRTVLTNSDRRSYQRIITKEVRVLRILRRMKKLTQDGASSVCGYSRPSIGHIENGRIEIPKERVEHIVRSYGFDIREFERLTKEEVLRDEVVELCFSRILNLSGEKLKLVNSILINF